MINYKLEESAFADTNSMDSEIETSVHNRYDNNNNNNNMTAKLQMKMDSSCVVHECLNARMWTDVFGKGKKSQLKALRQGLFNNVLCY